MLRPARSKGHQRHVEPDWAEIHRELKRKHVTLTMLWELRSVLLAIRLGGAFLFFGDAMITPAISVLSAIEGLQIATPVFKPYVVPMAAGVLVILFAIRFAALETTSLLAVNARSGATKQS